MSVVSGPLLLNSRTLSRETKQCPVVDKFFYKYDPGNAPTKYLRKEKPLSFGSIRVEVLHTPGHSTTPVLPGHGEQSTIGQEILTNPFLEDI